MATRAARSRARRGSGSIRPRGRRYVAQIDLGVGANGKRVRRATSFATIQEAQAWIDDQRLAGRKTVLPVANQRLDEYLRWWLEHEAPKGKPGRRPLAATTLAGYRGNIEAHLIPALGTKRVGELSVRDLDAFVSTKLALREFTGRRG